MSSADSSTAPMDRNRAIFLDDEPRPSRATGLRVRALRQILSHLTYGRITVVLPDGARIDVVAPHTGPDATLVLHRWRAIWRTVVGGDIGFAEAFIDDDCSSPDISNVVELFVRNEAALNALTGWVPMRLLNRLRHYRRANTRQGSKRNIIAHYDLGNAFFRHWLDDGMSYSSALYATPAQSLEDAQRCKQDRILEDLSLSPGMRVLEIGCGWGGLAERIVERGAHVTGLTLSPSQLAYARERLDATSDAHDLRLQDYRDVGGLFDRIVSIEMMEAVGRAFWPSYFATIRDRLARDGQAVLQVITIDETRFPAYVQDVDFIQRYIFPGGMLPTVTIMREQIAQAGLSLKSVYAFGESYARTLADWSRRFHGVSGELETMGYDKRFQRLWSYYLAYCEGGFRAGVLNVALYTITHATRAAESHR